MNILETHPDISRKKIRKIEIPSIGLGTHGMKGAECRESVADALEIGYRHIDTAQSYDNELDVGRGIQESGIKREDIFITEKIWWDNLSQQDLKRSFEESLSKLQTEYVDLLLIHWPSPEDSSNLKETLRAMFDLKKADKVKSIGVSNFTTELMRKSLAKEEIICNQIEYHPLLNQDEMLDLAKAHTFFVIAYSPLAVGEIANNELLNNIGRKYNKSAAQVALRWLIQQRLVVAIPKASSHEHRKSNLDIFDFSLEDGEMQVIHSLTRANKRMIDPEFAPWN